MTQDNKLMPCPFCASAGKNYESDPSLACCSNAKCPAHELVAYVNEWNTRADICQNAGDLDGLKREVLIHFREDIELDDRMKNPDKKLPTKRGSHVGSVIIRTIDHLAKTGRIVSKPPVSSEDAERLSNFIENYGADTDAPFKDVWPREYATIRALLEQAKGE